VERPANTGRNRVALVVSIDYGAVAEGQSHRLVVQFRGHDLLCRSSTDNWNAGDGVRMSTSNIVVTMPDPDYGPVDGITVLGGDPFAQVDGSRP
jgi:hypothetical protein